MAISSGSITSPMRTWEVMDCPLSLTLPATAEWEWQSIRPGVTCLPEPSIGTAFFGALRCCPTLAILPFSTITSQFSSVPLGPHVQTVAPRIMIWLGCSGSFVLPYAYGGYVVRDEGMGIGFGLGVSGFGLDRFFP